MTKTELAKKQGIARSTLYYKPKLPAKDEALKKSIYAIWVEFPSYGHKRLSTELNVNKKRIRRVMKVLKLKVPRRRGRKPFKPEDLELPESKVPNLLKGKDGEPIVMQEPNQAWAQDFTYLYFANSWWYVSTVLDLFTREVLGFAFSKRHDRHLILDALTEALATGRKPGILHSDQGSEYQSYDYVDLVKKSGARLSYSKKASPWQNGYQESFYSNFKLDLGETNQFETIGELVAAVYKTIYVYNHRRIHTKLKMSPKAYYTIYLNTKSTAQKDREMVS